MFDSQETPKQNGYISLANKYRPQTFEEVVGQESISKTLTNALKSGRIAHAYLFYGPRGCGKTTTARLLAKALNCTGYPEDKPTASPCGKCPQCIEIAASSDMDVLELDAASNTQVERVREAIIDTVALASGRDRFKVFILDEVHMLSTSSFNALLKTIEEPPGHVVFILATTELHKVPLTISSRCQTFRFKPITEEEITSHLMDLAGAENVDLEEEAAKIIAKTAGGALRDALTIFDRAISFSSGKIDKALVSEMLGLMPQDLVQEAVLSIVRNDSASLHKVFETVQNEGFDALSLLKDLKNAFGEIFYLSLKTGKEPFKGAADILKEASPGFIAGLTRKISKLIDEVKFSDTPLLSAEVGLFTIMENTLDIESFVSRLEALESSLNFGGYSEPEKKSLNNFSSPGVDSKPVKIPVKADFSASQEASPAPKQAQEPLAQPSAQKFESSSAMWGAFKTALSKNYPFLYEIVEECRPSFPSENKWILKFKSKDSFFKDTVKRRVKDLQNLALNACSLKVDFDFVLEEGLVSSASAAPVKAAASAVREPAKRVAAPAVKTPEAQQEAKPVTQSLISSEEPFVEGDFSSFAQGEAAPAPNKEIGETAKKILNIFDGYIVEAI